jgi:hypothetical protein
MSAVRRRPETVLENQAAGESSESELTDHDALRHNLASSESENFLHTNQAKANVNRQKLRFTEDEFQVENTYYVDQTQQKANLPTSLRSRK